MVLGIAARVDLFLEPEQAEVPRLVGAEPGDLDVVAQQVGVGRNLVVLAGEELLLVVEAGPPGQVGADLQVLTQDLSHHVGRVNPLGGFGNHYK